jgi:hypothetical protein
LEIKLLPGDHARLGQIENEDRSTGVAGSNRQKLGRLGDRKRGGDAAYPDQVLGGCATTRNRSCFYDSLFTAYSV